LQLMQPCKVKQENLKEVISIHKPEIVCN
jgi:hypothetical protein